MDLTKVQKEVIDLAEQGYLYPKNIINRRQKTKQAIYKTLRTLEKKGIIEKVDEEE